MARRKFRRKAKRKIPLAGTMGLALPLVRTAIDAFTSGNPLEAINRLGQSFTGYDFVTGSFNPAALSGGLVPAIVGGVISMIASKTGINRAFKGVPYLKI